LERYKSMVCGLKVGCYLDGGN